MAVHTTPTVFGVSNEPIKTYIERDAVDLDFKNALTLKKHIVVFGASKQGKTSLVQKHLPGDLVKVECAPAAKAIDLYSSILRQLGAEIETQSTGSSEASTEVGAGAKFKITIPFFGGGEASAQGKMADKESVSRSTKVVEFNLNLPQDVSELIRKLDYKKHIVLENFHYLTEEVQKQLAFDLRVFQDYNINFIVLGIWRERNRLTQYNGDLQDRVEEIPVEPWDIEDLRRIIVKGSELLNVDFSQVQDQILQASFDSVGVLQEVCKEICLCAGVTQTAESRKAFGPGDLNCAIERKLSAYSGRHVRALEAFVASSQTESSGLLPLYLPYYFVRSLLEYPFEDIQGGLQRTKIHDGIRALHHRPSDVRASDMSNFLHNIVRYQIARQIEPPLFDYDQGSRILKIIDSTLYFFLRHVDRQQFFSELPPPSDKLALPNPPGPLSATNGVDEDERPQQPQ